MKLRDFLLTWLRADQPHDLSRDPKKFPGFDAAVVSDLKMPVQRWPGARYSGSSWSTARTR